MQKHKLLLFMLFFMGIAQAAMAQKEAYAALSEDGETVTFYYDTQKASREGVVAFNSSESIGDYQYVTTAVFDASFADYRPTSTAYWFYECRKLNTIKGLKNLNTKNVTDMSKMFAVCWELKSIDFSNINTANVKYMKEMFAYSSALSNLDLSNFNTAEVTDMSGMFEQCYGFENLDLSSFNTANVTDMSSMFNSCGGLKNLDLSNFNTSNVKSMQETFYNCWNLQSLDLSCFNTANVTNMVCMFGKCRNLTTLDLSSFNTENVTDMESMFSDCSSLTSLNLSSFNTANVTDMVSMFSGCKSLTSLDLSSFNTANVTDMSHMFFNCKSLTSLDLSSFNTANVENMCCMFDDCSSLSELNLSSFNTANVFNMVEMFLDCSSLKSLDLSSFNTGKVGFMNGMFSGCSSLMSLNLSSFNTKRVQEMSEMFLDCSSLKSLDLTTFNTKNVRYISKMFSGCYSLTTIYIDETLWSTEFVLYGKEMFYNCTNLVGGNGTVYEESHKDYEYACADLPGQPGYLSAINYIDSSGIVLKVTDDAGNNVTPEVNIIWYDSNRKQVGTGSKLYGVAEDAEVYYSVELEEALGRVYREVSMRKAEAEDIVITCQLEKIGRVELQGRVSGADIDKSTVTVNVHQLLNGKWEQDYTTQADDQGQFNIEVYDDVTDITLSGDGYLNATVHRDGFGGNGNVGTIPISLLTGFAVVANITMTKAVAAGEAAESTLLTDRLTDIDFTLTNQTKGNQLTDVAVQNGSIVIKSGAAVGDKISLTAKSKQGVFADASTTFTLIEGTNSFDLQVKELGGIEATCTASNNGTTVGYLYDRNDVLATKGTYQGETLSLRHLKNGIYTLVTMGQSLLLGNMANLSDLRKVGLTEGTDYVTTRISVTDGLLATASISEVPHMNDTQYYYTNGNTYLNADKASVTAGNYLTLRTHIDFKAEHADKAGYVTLTIDLPKGCQMVRNSVIANHKLVAYTVNGQRVSMQLSKEQYESEVRMCVIPTLNKNYTVTAIAQFNIGGNVQQPVGTAQFEAKGLSLFAPKLTAKTNVTVTGTAQPNSEVSVYDNDVLVGTTTSKADGTWMAQCELFKPYSPSFHDIYAKIATSDGMELTSEMKRVEYDKTQIIPESVLMTCYNGWYKKNFDVTFNLQDGTTTPTSYPYYTATDFTFLADFTRNAPERISNVNIRVLNSDGTVRNLPATFDEKQGKWVATSRYANASRLPQNVMVEYDHIKSSPIYDDEMKSELEALTNNLEAEVDNAYKNCAVEVIDEDENSATIIATTNGYGTKEKFNINVLNYEQTKAKYANEFYCKIENQDMNLGFVVNINDDNSSNMIVWNNNNKTAFEISTDGLPNASMCKQHRIVPLKLLSGVWSVAQGIIEYELRLHRGILPWVETLESERIRFGNMLNKNIELLHAKCKDGSYKIKDAKQFNALKGEITKCSNSYQDFLDEFNSNIELNKQKLKHICTAKTFLNVIASTVTGAVFDVGGAILSSISVYSTAEVLTGIAIKEYYSQLMGNAVGDLLVYSPEEMISLWYGKHSQELINQFIQLSNDIKGSYSKCDKDPEENNDEATDDHSGFPCKGTTPIIDPSGFVYEAVLSNRLEGVTTTCYQQVGGSAVQWNAEDYSQQNPLVTDETGFYRWDVPQGMWQVKYEKEGYETAYSDWLPVPPPQLDVNISMKQSTPPTVKEMHGYETGIVIEMGKYMLPGTMTTKNITVTCNGKTVSGAIELMNSEESPLGDETYVSKVKFVPKDNFSSSDVVVVTVHKEVESYCGVTMAADHVETVKIEPEIKSIVSDETVTVPYQGEHELRVVVLPKDAAAGKTLRVSTSSEIIASVNEPEVEIGQDGTATIVLGGELPGGAVLKFSIDGTDVTATTKVQVAMESDMAETPTANIASGETITSGTTLTLSCGTPGATIYYTLDGSCPCDEATRLLYEGPIVLSSDAVVKAIAVCEGLDDSDVATFVYVVTGIGNSLADTGVRVGCHGRTVTVTGAEGASCWIYDLRGGEVAHRSNLSRQAKFDVKAAGVYLVCIRPKKGQPMVAKIVVR